MITPQQRPRRGLDIVLPHQALADKEGPHPRAGKALAVGVGVDAAFADQQRACGRERGEAFGGGEIGGEGFQIAVVDPDQARLQRVSTGHFGLVVDLDQNVHAVFARGSLDLVHLRV